jgi:hypothetical protein
MVGSKAVQRCEHSSVFVYRKLGSVAKRERHRMSTRFLSDISDFASFTNKFFMLLRAKSEFCQLLDGGESCASHAETT